MRKQYLDAVRAVLGKLELQQILSAALVATSLRSDGWVHMFGSARSLLLAVEAFFRAGGLVAVNPILDRRLQFDGGVLESTEFERISGTGQELAREAGFRTRDVGVVASNNYCPGRDAAVALPGIPACMGPVSTIAGSALLHAVFEAAARLASEGSAPTFSRV